MGDGSGEWGDHSTPQCQLAADEAVPEVLAAVTPPRHWSNVVWCNSAPSGPQFMRDCKFECRLKQQIWSTCIRFFCNGDKACDEFSVAILRRTKICNFNTFFQSSAKASKVSRFEWNLHQTLLPTLRWARVKMRRVHQKLRNLFKISWVNFFPDTLYIVCYWASNDRKLKCWCENSKVGVALSTSAIWHSPPMWQVDISWFCIPQAYVLVM